MPVSKPFTSSPSPTSAPSQPAAPASSAVKSPTVSALPKQAPTASTSPAPSFEDAQASRKSRQADIEKMRTTVNANHDKQLSLADKASQDSNQGWADFHTREAGRVQPMLNSTSSLVAAQAKKGPQNQQDLAFLSGVGKQQQADLQSAQEFKSRADAIRQTPGYKAKPTSWYGTPDDANTQFGGLESASRRPAEQDSRPSPWLQDYRRTQSVYSRQPNVTYDNPQDAYDPRKRLVKINFYKLAAVPLTGTPDTPTVAPKPRPQLPMPAAQTMSEARNERAIGDLQTNMLRQKTDASTANSQKPLELQADRERRIRDQGTQASLQKSQARGQNLLAYQQRLREQSPAGQLALQTNSGARGLRGGAAADAYETATAPTPARGMRGGAARNAWALATKPQMPAMTGDIPQKPVA